MRTEQTPWTATDEALWYEVFVRCIYGGMLPETARKRVATLSPYGSSFAVLIHDRWWSMVQAIRDGAITEPR